MATEDDDSIFPLVERRTPVRDRLQQMRDERNANKSGSLEDAVAKEVVKAVQREEDEADEAVDETADKVRSAIAEEAGVDEEAISEEFAITVGTVLSGASGRDVFSPEAAEALGLGAEEEDTDFSADE